MRKTSVMQVAVPPLEQEILSTGVSEESVTKTNDFLQDKAPTEPHTKPVHRETVNLPQPPGYRRLLQDANMEMDPYKNARQIKLVRSYQRNVPVTTNVPDDVIQKMLTEHVEYMQSIGTVITIHFNDMIGITSEQTVFTNDISHSIIEEYHNHDFFEINYVFSGKLYQYINDEFVVMSKGDLLVMHPSVSHSLLLEKSSGAVNLLISPEFMRSLIRFLPENSPFPLMDTKCGYLLYSTSAYSEIKRLMHKICSYRYNIFLQESGHFLLFEGLVQQLIAELTVSAGENAPLLLKHGTAQSYDEQVQQILKYVHDNYATVTVESVSHRFNYSRMQISRIFKKYLGMSFSEYLTRQRISRAKYLLARTDTSMEEISRMIGLERAYFFTFFKKVAGVTPHEYRKNHYGERAAIY